MAMAHSNRSALRQPLHCSSGLVAVCVAEVALAGMLWTAAPHATALSYALLPLELAFWIGFALPLGPPLGITRTVLVLLARPSTHQTGTRNQLHQA